MGSGSQVPKYAILSHTWEDGEVTFQDFTHSNREVTSKKKGYGKIEKTCLKAQKDGLKYAWVDTCCIDKTSSAELAEAINSMFQWYMDAVVCYAWLADLRAEERIELGEPNSGFKNCRWFTRGWTLQELIAPKRVEFYDQDWNLRGTKAELNVALSCVTGISVEVLRNASLLYRLPVAQRMSWAANRQTTRIEDMAYCLLGIFDVNMPMLYGEGPKAFIRLQEEIAKESNDLSLFAWKAEVLHQKYHGILASTPAEFRNSGAIQLNNDPGFNEEFMMTNKGLRIKADLHPRPDGTYLMRLNCSQSAPEPQQVGIWIKQHGGGVYGRTNSDELGVSNPGEVAKTTSIFISKRISSALSADLEGSHSHAFMFRQGFNERGSTDSPAILFEATSIKPEAEWESQRRMFLTHGVSAFTGFAFFYPKLALIHAKDKRVYAGNSFMIAVGKTEISEKPWLAIATRESNREIFKCMSDLKKLGAVGSKCKDWAVTLRDMHGKETCVVSVSLEETVVEGELVYCIDIAYTDPGLDKLGGDKGTVESPLALSRREGQ